MKIDSVLCSVLAHKYRALSDAYLGLGLALTHCEVGSEHGPEMLADALAEFEWATADLKKHRDEAMMSQCSPDPNAIAASNPTRS